MIKKEDLNVDIVANGNFTISYKNIDYSFKSGNSYTIDGEVAKQFTESGYCSYAELDNISIENKLSDMTKDELNDYAASIGFTELNTRDKHKTMIEKIIEYKNGIY